MPHTISTSKTVSATHKLFWQMFLVIGHVQYIMVVNLPYSDNSTCFHVNLFLPIYPYNITVAATVALELHDYSFCEGNGTVEVCVQLIQTPIGGLQCSIVVDLSFSNGTKAGRV